jgi:phenylacetate-CoA ligase
VSPDTLTLADLPRLPILRKESLPRKQAEQPLLAGWLAKPLADVRRLFVSPGPIYEPEGRVPDYWGFAPALFAAGFRRGDVVLNTFSYHLTPAGAMFDGGLEELGCVVVPTGVGNVEIQVQTLRDTRARGFIGTPSFLALVLGKQSEQGARSSLEVAYVSGEPLSETLRHDLERRHQVCISQAYATGDIGLIAYECPHRTGLHLAERVIVEIVAPAASAAPIGETGEVVVTFLNDLYPLLRLGTGDLSRFVSGDCACGRTSARLERIIGRVGDAVKVRGIFLHPHDLERAIARHPEITRYQAVITQRDHQDELTVRVEAGAASARIAAQVAQSVRETTRLRAVVDVLPPGTLGSEEKHLVDKRTWE